MAPAGEHSAKLRYAGDTDIMMCMISHAGEADSLMAIASGIVVGILMAVIGSALLFRPRVIFNLLLALNPNSNYARRRVRSIEAAVVRVRLVGAISLAWGLFVGYLIIRALLHSP